MAKKAFELYLDESGNFYDGTIATDKPAEVSLVGGLLAEKGKMNDAYALKLLPHHVHCCEEYKKYYIDVLEQLINDGSRFVIFENKERMQVINGDTTYLNIVSEGLVKLLRDLSNEYPEGVDIEIIIATRKAMNAFSGIISTDRYARQLEEKILMALGRNHVNGCEHTLTFKDARYYKQLDFADIICNTYLTRHRSKKFSPEEQARIEQIYDAQLIYPVFEDAMTVYIKQLILERHYGEALFQICTLQKLTRFTALRNQVLRAIESADPYEQDTWFGQMSLLIGQYNNLKLYKDGIMLAENYISYFLNLFTAEGHIGRILPFWRFDTNFYLLTMYDHIGNAAKCQEHLEACRQDITSVNRSWEHIDYYFAFCIRELNVLMGRYAFDEVIEKSKDLIKIFTEARDLFGMIKTYNGVEQAVKSELLGKTYGVQLEAMINLLHKRPELIDTALELSENAMAEFIDARDISRQYQWRCLMMTQAGRPMEAYEALLKAAGIENDANAPKAFIDSIYNMNPGAYDFLLWHYTNVLLALKESNNALGDEMAHALLHKEQFVKEYKSNEKKGHPWNLVLWNIGRYFRCIGELNAYNTAYKKALQITRENKANVTMYAFALSMSADKLLWDRQNNNKMQSKTDFELVCKDMFKAGITDEMCAFFGITGDMDYNKLTNEALAAIAKAYLK